MQTSAKIPIAIVVGGIILAAAVYLSAPAKPQTTPHAGNPDLVRPVGPTDHIFGNPNAKVFIVEYSDFDCEYCKGFNDTLHQIIANEGDTGQVAWVFREFPITEVHPNAFKHAEAAECAAQVGGNDAFWKFADELFAGQPVNPTSYGGLAKNIGLPTEAFANCYSNASSTVAAHITADRQNALDMGAPGAPYTLIVTPGQTPTVLYGAYSYNALKQAVDDAVASAK